eukprot:Em0016g364a
MQKSVLVAETSEKYCATALTTKTIEEELVDARRKQLAAEQRVRALEEQLTEMHGKFPQFNQMTVLEPQSIPVPNVLTRPRFNSRDVSSSIAAALLKSGISKSHSWEQVHELTSSRELSYIHSLTQHRQYPPGTETVYSYFESRGGKFPEVVFFGLQYIIKRWLVGQVVTKEKIEEAKAFSDAHLGPGLFNYAGWMHILEKHGGRLPIRIKAVPEGAVIPYKNVLVTGGEHRSKMLLAH